MIPVPVRRPHQNLERRPTSAGPGHRYRYMFDRPGIKSLYSVSYFSEEDFYRQYNGELYKKIKERYDPTGRLRGWYDRVCRS